MFRSLSTLRTLQLVYNPSRLITTGSANTLKVREEVNRVKKVALLGGGQKRIDAQHKKGIEDRLKMNDEDILSFRKINCTGTN